MRNKLFATAKGVIRLFWCIAAFSLFVAVTANGPLSASTTPQISIGLQTSSLAKGDSGDCPEHFDSIFRIETATGQPAGLVERSESQQNDLNGFAGGKATPSNSIKAKFIMDNGESIEVESKDDIPIDWDKYKEMPVVKCLIYDNEIIIVSEKNKKGELTIKCKCIPLKLKQIFHKDSGKNASPQIVASTMATYCILKGLWSGVMGVWSLYEDDSTISFWPTEVRNEFVVSFIRGFASGVGDFFPAVKIITIMDCGTSYFDEIVYLYGNVDWKDFTITSFWGFISFCRKNFQPSDYANVAELIIGCVL